VPDGFVEKLNQQMASICDDLPAESKPACCPARNQTVIDEVTQMMHITTDAETLAGLQARLDELYAATPTCDANLCWLESETIEFLDEVSSQYLGSLTAFLLQRKLETRTARSASKSLEKPTVSAAAECPCSLTLPC